MKRLDVSPRCCGVDSVWVDNIPGKEYYYCRECKLEVGLEEEFFVKAVKSEMDKILDTAFLDAAMFGSAIIHTPNTIGSGSIGPGQMAVPGGHPYGLKTPQPKSHTFVFTQGQGGLAGNCVNCGAIAGSMNSVGPCK